MKLATTLCEIVGAIAAIAGTVLLYGTTIAGGLLATAVLAFGASYVLSGQ